MKKNLLFCILIFTIAQRSVGQQMYCDFDGIKAIKFGLSTGVLDSLVVNPHTNSIDSSRHCAKYIRDTALYDNIKLYPDMKLMDITPFADSTPGSPKIIMKLYSSAPVGTVILLQLGIKGNDTYPAGVHSVYITTTTVKNAWENVIFNYFESPVGSVALATEIDKVVILFNPNSVSRDTMYFDDLVGPALNSSASVPAPAPAFFKLHQNSPNPAKENTRIDFQLNYAGKTSLKLYDLLGNSISSLLDQNMKAGNYSVPFDTENIPNGIYFCVLTKEGDSRSIKVIVSK